MLPRVLKNFNAFVEGIGYAGRVAEIEPPSFKVKGEEIRNGGMDGAKSVDMGIELLTAKLTFDEYLPEIMKAVGTGDTEGSRVQFRGAIQRNAEDAIPVVIEMHGSFDEEELGTWKSGDKPQLSITVNLGYYKLTIDGDLIREIDVDNCVRNTGGIDRMASIRAAIGI